MIFCLDFTLVLKNLINVFNGILVGCEQIFGNKFPLLLLVPE